MNASHKVKDAPRPEYIGYLAGLHQDNGDWLLQVFFETVVLLSGHSQSLSIN